MAAYRVTFASVVARTAPALLVALTIGFGLGALQIQTAYAAYESASIHGDAAHYASVEYEVANPTVYMASDDDLIWFSLNRIGDKISFKETASSAPVVYEQRCMPNGNWRFVNVADNSDLFDPDDLKARLVTGEWRLGANEVTLEVGGATCTYSINVVQQDASKYSPITFDFDHAHSEFDVCDTGAVYYREEGDDEDDSAWHLNGHGFAIDPYPATMYLYPNYAYDIEYVGYRVDGGRAHELKISPLGVYQVPPVTGAVTIIARSKQTATVADGVMSFPTSKGLPNAYRLDIDLGKNVEGPRLVLSSSEDREVVTIPSDSYLEMDYYLWPDCENRFIFQLDASDSPRSLKLAPADAGKVSQTPINDNSMLVTITLSKPATLHIGTDGSIRSADPKQKTVTYTGKALKPAIKVKTDSRTLQQGREYTVSYSNNVNVGTATATVRGINGYTGEKAVKFKIAKAPNTVKVKSSISKTVSAKSLKKKAATIALPKAKAKFGTVKWSVAKKDGKKVLSLKGGQVRVKKGAKRGVCKLKLTASVPGTANYNKASKTIAIRITIV